jgi:cytidylate kinase
MTTITISRDFGSEGDNVARRVADDLGYHFVDKEIIGNVLGNYGIVEFDKEYDSLMGFWAKFDAQRDKRRDTMVEMLNRVLEAFAVHGNTVILGRSGFSVLAGYADAFHIRLQESFPSRVRRMMKNSNLTHVEASLVCEDGDKIRADFVQNFYGISWDAAHAFDMVLNMEKIVPDQAVGYITNAVRDYELISRKGKPTTGMLEVDPIMTRAVNEILHCTIDHRELAAEYLVHA